MSVSSSSAPYCADTPRCGLSCTEHFGRIILDESSLQNELTHNSSNPQIVHPKIHPCVDAPLCLSCQNKGSMFFDPICFGCQQILVGATTTVPEIFAILRQWNSSTQRNLSTLMVEILRHGIGIDDRDGLTDMTLLHYACKAGAAGIGDAENAAKVVSDLLKRGADVNIRCRWTDMTALHYAAYFNVAPVIYVLLNAAQDLDIDTNCSEFEHGTALHIACSNMALESVKVLIELGSNISLKDDLCRTAYECCPDVSQLDLVNEWCHLAEQIRQTIQQAPPSSTIQQLRDIDDFQSNVTLESLGLQLGDKVVVNGAKSGSLKYCGPTEFAFGLWAGVELYEPVGKNDGSIAGISYFKCREKYGIFAPISKISKQQSLSASLFPSFCFDDAQGKKMDLPLSMSNIESGDRVIVARRHKGTIRYIGETMFASGTWLGIELDRPFGKNNGSVKGVHYFACHPRHGIFSPPSRIEKLGDCSFHSGEMTCTISSMAALSEKRSRMKPADLKESSKKHDKIAAVPSKYVRNDSKCFTLEVGMSLLCNNELGTIRYIGPTAFGEGTWLGVELRTAKGRNNGCVNGHRYFSCKPGHGLLVRPSKVTVRGINGAKLLAGVNAHG